MKSIAGWGLLLSLLATLAVPVALADARDHFKRGQAAYQQGNYDLAISEWLSGYEMEQRPEFQYNLAQAYERLGRLQDAVNSLQRFVESADPDDASYSDATARLASLQQRLALTGVRILGGPDGASIYVDDRDWGRLPRPDKISVAPGAHKIVVKLAGYRDFVSNVVIPAGQVIDIEISMTAGAADPTPTPGLTPVEPAPTGGAIPAGPTQHTASLPTDSGSSSNASTWLYVGIGTGGLAVISLIGLVERGSQIKECEEPANFCSNLNTVRDQRNLWGASTLLFGAASIASFVLYATADTGGSQSASASCAPGILSAACTVTF